MSVTTKRNYVWRHNSFFGAASMTEMNMKSIISAVSTSPEAKAIAEKIRGEIPGLIAALRKRIDPK
jgi:hypothetical protein